MNRERYQEYVDAAAEELPDDLGGELICYAEDLQRRAEQRRQAALMSYLKLPWRASGYASVLIEAALQPPAIGFSLDILHHGAGNA